MKWEQAVSLNDGKFKRLVGVKRSTFRDIVSGLKKPFEEKLKHGGRKPKLCLEDMILATLSYMREYRTFEALAITYGIHESNMHRTITWCEDEMIKLDMFSLPGMKSLRSDQYKKVTIDVTECIIERPKENQKAYYSGKKNGTH